MTETAATTPTKRFMYTCHRCKHVWAREYRTYTGGRSSGHLFRIQEDIPGARMHILQEHDYTCPACGRTRTESNLIKGHVSDHICDPRCTGAKGHDCECACGGANHGKDHLVR